MSGFLAFLPGAMFLFLTEPKRLSQGKLAKAIGVHVTNISRYERGENMPLNKKTRTMPGFF
jgi:transcriptional regulator with XRE-family HTH domain